MSSDEELITEEVENIEITQDDEALVVGEPMETEEVTTETNEVTEATDTNEENKKAVKPKRVVRNPQPKLNEQTIMGARGIGALENYFERVKFKGKGHEENDLNMLMKTYEYWCHRLFPKYPFDSCIARLETLGSKRAVITHIKKIRMGIENEDKELVPDEEPEIQTQNNGFVNEVNDQFDQLLSTDTPNENITTTILTEDQQEKIRHNKEKAERIRKEKLQKIRELSTNSVPTSGQQQSQDIFAGTSYTNSESVNITDQLDINNTSSNINTISDVEPSQIINSQLRHECEPYELNTEIENHDVDKNCDIHKENEYKLLAGNFTPTEGNCNGGMLQFYGNNPESEDENNEVDLDQILNIINVNSKETNICTELKD